MRRPRHQCPSSIPKKKGAEHTRALEKTDIHFRDVDSLKIEEVWIKVYHGGETTVQPRIFASVWTTS